jgi:hypothetical protein
MQVALRNDLIPDASPALGRDIDNLGALRARIAALEAEEKALAASVKARLIERGREAVNGDAFLAAINVAERVTLDGKAAEALLVANGLEVPRRSQVVETLRIVKLA